MTKDEILTARSLQGVTPRQEDKRFAQEMIARSYDRAFEPLTEKQAKDLEKLAHRYRNEIAEQKGIAA